MTPYYADDWLTVYLGNCVQVLSQMDDESVNCVVTSPPYWGLRDYGTATWDGGDPKCAHVLVNTERTAWANSVPGPAGAIGKNAQSRNETKETGGECAKCHAGRVDLQLGLEATPELYAEAMVNVFHEVWRVLRKDGTLWLNLGDSYAGSWSGNSMRPDGGSQRPGGPGFQPLDVGVPARSGVVPLGLKPKDLVGIPWRVAFALQADGWYLRSDIIWAKPNPMPESVTDRPTKAHEYLFLLSKSPNYYYDAAAVAETLTDSSVSRLSQPTIAEQRGSDRVPGKTNGPMKAVGHLDFGALQPLLDAGFSLDLVPPGEADGPRNPTWDERKAAGATAGNVGVSDTYQNGVHGAGLVHDLGTPGTRNLRSVWTVSTVAYPGAHFATFPPKLIEPCIKAGCPEGGIVLDPFAGSGTTGLVANRLSRRAVLIDLSAAYLEQLMRRNADVPLGLVESA